MHDLTPLKTPDSLKTCALLGVCMLLAGFLLIATDQTWLASGQWLLQSLILWALVWQQTWLRRDLNRFAPDALLYPDLGLANHLTLLRGLLIAATGGFLFMPLNSGWIAWVPAALYSLAAILDRVDGYVARRTARTSLLGTQLDTVFDALGLLVAPLLAVSYGKVHWTYLLVSIAYYLFVWGQRWRRRHGLPVYPLVPGKLRRTLAGFQMAYIAVVLWPPFDARITVIAGFAFMLPLLTGFAVDWLVVSGRIKPALPTTAAFFSRLSVFGDSLLQPVLRLVTGLALFVVIQDFSSITGICLLIAAALLLLGLGGRIAAAAILMLLAWQSPENVVGSTANDTFIGAEFVALLISIFGATGVLLLGGGRYSLWQWDDRWVNQQDGA